MGGVALPEQLQELARRVSNWGRWGDDDERGTLNFIDAAAVLRGVAAVRRGATFSLAIPMHAGGPQTGGIPGRINPQHRMIAVNQSYTGDPDDFTTSDDAVDMGIQAATHWDTLAHAGYGNQLYNGFPDRAITDAGAAHLGVEHFGSIVSRGVLLDVARLHGVDHFDDNHVIGADDLEGARSAADVVIERGDIVMVRTGQMHFLRAGERERYSHPSPGLGVGSIEWLHDHEIAAVATDNLTFEVFPCEERKVLFPVHMINLRDQGLVQGQVWHLDELAADCANDGIHECLLVATPLPITGAVGGTVAPTAVK
jgi:kynurenine formamidase